MKANKILFRGVDVETEKSLVYFALSDVTHGYSDGSLLVKVPAGDSSSKIEHVKDIQRYSGLKDINGKPIFEGDILKTEIDSGSMYKVSVDVESGGLRLAYNSFDVSLPLAIHRIKGDRLYVAGNMTETPEMWKGGEE